MTHKPLRARLLAIVLLISFAQAGVAQVGMQQMSGSRAGAAASGNRSGAAAAGSTSGLTIVPGDFTKLRLAPGFMVSLNVLDDPDLVGSFRIDEQGDLTLPILGTMHVAGKTVPEARVQIQEKLLKDQILRDPQVILTVLEYTPPEVTIIGEVNNPGKYPMLAPRNLVDVLALAGATTPAAGNEVQITRGGADAEPLLVHYSRATNAKAVEDVIVHPGDTVQVKRAGIVYVLGAVNRPGGYVMQEEGTLSVLQAISLASGTTILASTGTIHLLRRNADGSMADVALPYKQISRGKSADVQLHATDVLYVPTNAIKLLYSDVQSLVNAAGTASIYVGLGR